MGCGSSSAADTATPCEPQRQSALPGSLAGSASSGAALGTPVSANPFSGLSEPDGVSHSRPPAPALGLRRACGGASASADGERPTAGGLRVVGSGPSQGKVAVHGLERMLDFGGSTPTTVQTADDGVVIGDNGCVFQPVAGASAAPAAVLLPAAVTFPPGPGLAANSSLPRTLATTDAVTPVAHLDLTLVSSRNTSVSRLPRNTSSSRSLLSPMGAQLQGASGSWHLPGGAGSGSGSASLLLPEAASTTGVAAAAAANAASFGRSAASSVVFPAVSWGTGDGRAALKAASRSTEVTPQVSCGLPHFPPGEGLGFPFRYTGEKGSGVGEMSGGSPTFVRGSFFEMSGRGSTRCPSSEGGGRSLSGCLAFPLEAGPLYEAHSWVPQLQADVSSGMHRRTVSRQSAESPELLSFGRPAACVPSQAAAASPNAAALAVLSR